MRVLLQWTKAHPEDWLEVDVRPTGPFRRAWERLAAKALPTGGETIDDNPGWVFGLNIQGVEIGGFDHYAGEPFTDENGNGAIRVWGWNDDPVDWPVGTRQGYIWEFREGWATASFDVPGGVVTHEGPNQRLTVYLENPADIARWTGANYGVALVDVHPWTDFVVPDTAITRHGIWVSDDLFRQHKAIRAMRGWDEWTPRP